METAIKHTMLDAAVKFARDFGIFACLSIVLIWWNQQEKKEMQAQINASTSYVQNEFRKSLDRATRVIEANTIAIDALARNQKITAEELAGIRERLKNGGEVSP